MSPVNGEIDLPGFDASCAPAQVQNYPSMTTKGEKSLLYWLARHYFSGDGLIVDAGLFLGASTNAFATGLKENAQALARIEPGRKPIHSYDIAIWVQGMDKYLIQHATQKALKGKTPKRGASFEPILRELLRAHQPLVDLRIGDIVKTASADRPVEIAFYDCLKSKAVDWAVFKAFGPHYVPGRTIVVQQDYFFEGAPDNKIRQEFLDPYFTYLGGMATSAVFRLDKALPQAFFEKDPIDELSAGEQRVLLARAAQRAIEPKWRLYAQMSEVLFTAQHVDRGQALAQLEEIEAEMKKHPIELLGTRMLQAVATLRERVLPQDGAA